MLSDGMAGYERDFYLPLNVKMRRQADGGSDAEMSAVSFCWYMRQI